MYKLNRLNEESTTVLKVAIELVVLVQLMTKCYRAPKFVAIENVRQSRSAVFRT